MLFRLYLIENYNATLTYAYNFAHRGATVNASLVAPHESTVLSLINLVKQFSDDVASEPSDAPWAATDSLLKSGYVSMMSEIRGGILRNNIPGGNNG